jgi:hypothetical protein
MGKTISLNYVISESWESQTPMWFEISDVYIFDVYQLSLTFF